jgi:hypothetical protein
MYGRYMYITEEKGRSTSPFLLRDILYTYKSLSADQVGGQWVSTNHSFSSAFIGPGAVYMGLITRKMSGLPVPVYCMLMRSA